MIKQVPNLITSLNLLCGCVAVFFAVSGDLVTAAIFVCFGIFFDFFDGLTARLLHAQSEVGLQLDSLADAVTSGVVPGIVMVQLLSEALLGGPMVIADTFGNDTWNEGMIRYVPFVGLLITVASVYRLAKFNVDTRQTSSFIGLPTPANTLLVLSLKLIIQFQYSEMLASIIYNQWFLFGFTILSCILLNAELPLFALKFKHWGFKGNAVRYIFLVLCVVLLVLFQFLAIPMVIVLYVLLSLLWKDKEVR